MLAKQRGSRGFALIGLTCGLLGFGDLLVLDLHLWPAYLAARRPRVVASTPVQPPPRTTREPSIAQLPARPPAPRHSAHLAPATDAPPAKDRQRSEPRPVPGRQPLATIRFDTDSRTVDHRGHRALLRLARRLAPSAKLSIEGHADQRGDERYNEWLGLQRARAVRRLLRRAGIDRDGLLPPVTWGSRSPRSRESGPSAWAQNRRVEVFDVADEGSR